MTSPAFDPSAAQVGTISEGILGSLSVYLCGLKSEVDEIAAWRREQDLSLSENSDEFYVLLPSDSHGTEEASTTYSGSNQTVTKRHKPPLAGKEPIVLYKAFYYPVANFIQIAIPGDLDLNSNVSFINTGKFNLPKIPAAMVSKLDKFFRAVDDKHGTEAIVLLTYDFQYIDAENSADGWGFAVPDQNNTSTHCSYDTTEIRDNLPEGTEIVGTIHSHPKMTAYASATDKADQTGFTGLHITFGWLTSKGNVTEYHAELVNNDLFYGVDPSIVMDLDATYVYEIETEDGVIYADPAHVRQVENDYGIDEAEVAALMESVKKATHVHTAGNRSGTALSAHNPNHQGGGSGKALPAAAGQKNQGTYNYTHNLPAEYPEGLLEFGWAQRRPDPRESIVVVKTTEDAKLCPVCTTTWGVLAYEAIARRQCLACGVFFVIGDEGFKETVDHRIQNGYLDLNEYLPEDIPVWIFDPEVNDFTLDTNPGGGPKKAQSGFQSTTS